MDAIVAFFDKLVSEFTWRRLLFIISTIFLALLCLWGFENLSGHFREARTTFEINELQKLADPQLRKNVEGDKLLESSYQSLKEDLSTYLSQSQRSVVIPKPIVRAAWTLVPWIILDAIIALQARGKDVGGAILGTSAVAIPLAIIGAVLPGAESWWPNALLFPWGTLGLTLAVLLAIQKMKSSGKPAPV